MRKYLLAAFAAVLVAVSAANAAGVLNLVIAQTTGAAFSPTNISGLVLWLDASDGATITQSGGAVSQWNDKSGNSNNVVQATAGQQPTVQTADQNGLNTLLFTSAGSQLMTAAAPISIPNTTVVVVVKRSSGKKVETIGLQTDTAAVWAEWYSDDNIYTYNTHKYMPGASTYTDTTSYHFLAFSIDNTGNSMATYYDSATAISYGAATNSVYATGTFDTISRADNAYSDMKIGEILVYNSALSQANIANLYSFEKNKWATP